MEVLMHLYPQEDIRIPWVQIRLQVFNPQLVCMRKQRPGMLLDPPPVTSQRILYSQMRYQARSAGASRIIIWPKVLVMEDGTLKQTQQGKTERPTLQARMIPPWTWFQTAPETGTTKVVHGEMLHAQPGSIAIAYQYSPWLLYVLYFP
jgi:hypothetical protein